MPHPRHERGSQPPSLANSIHTLPENHVIEEEPAADLDSNAAASSSTAGWTGHSRRSFHSEVARNSPVKNSWASDALSLARGLARSSGQGLSKGGEDGQASGTRKHSATSSMTSSRRPSLIHELHLQSSTTTSRPLSSHQLMLLTPFGSPIPSISSPSLKRSPQENEKEIDVESSPKRQLKSGRPVSPSGYARKRGSAPVALPSHRRQPSTTASDQHYPRPASPSHFSRAPTSSSTLRTQAPTTDPTPSTPILGNNDDSRAPPVPTQLSPLAVHVPMTRSLSLPILTLSELEALREKEADLGIVRNEGWAWVSGGFEETTRVGSYDSANSLSRYSPSTSIPQRSFLPSTGTERSSPPIFADPFRRSSVTSQHHNRSASGMGAQSTSNWATFFDFDLARRDSGDRRESGEDDARVCGSPRFGSGSSFGGVLVGQGGGPGAQMGSEGVSATNSGSSSTQPPGMPILTRYRTSPASFQHRGLEITFGPEDVPLSRNVRSGDNDGGGNGETRQQVNLSDEFGRRLSITSNGSLFGIGGEGRQRTRSSTIIPEGIGGNLVGAGKLGSPKRTVKQGSWASIAITMGERPFGLGMLDDGSGGGSGGGRRRFASVDGGRSRVEENGIWAREVVRRGSVESWNDNKGAGRGRGSVSSERGWRRRPWM